ncbi:MAG: DUF86 domain-containing protein [Cyclobacteriaceae bacterium]|nr:DUF86 domain-containing protein [Cyclobacteriaceae bacterium HetDA_MAG_MS6]
MKTDRGAKVLTDILKAIELIEVFIDGVSFSRYTNDLKTKSAVERQLSIVGEAVVQYESLTGKTIDSKKRIRGFRNRLIHAYDAIDDSIVWAIIKNHLNELKSQIQSQIEK